MNEIIFDWDENKNQINIKKHNVSFEEASGVFYDPLAIIFDDPDHSMDEERFLIIGVSSLKRVCTVSHCYRGTDENVIRIISARLATKHEITEYLEIQGDIL